MFLSQCGACLRCTVCRYICEHLVVEQTYTREHANHWSWRNWEARVVCGSIWPPTACLMFHSTCWMSPMHPTAPHTCLRDDQWLISLQNGTFALDTGSLWGLSDTYIPSGRTLHTVPLLHLAYHIGHLFHKEYHITTYICITYCNFLLRFLLRWH